MQKRLQLGAGYKNYDAQQPSGAESRIITGNLCPAVFFAHFRGWFNFPEPSVPVMYRINDRQFSHAAGHLYRILQYLCCCLFVRALLLCRF